MDWYYGFNNMQNAIIFPQYLVRSPYAYNVTQCCCDPNLARNACQFNPNEEDDNTDDLEIVDYQ